MTVTTTYPGVYITEIPSGSRTIVGVATSITAFVGGAPRGPVNEPVPIASFADFERTFGGLARGSGLGYAVRDFYLNGGGDALVVRLVHMVPDDPDDPDDNPATDPASAATAQIALFAAPDTEGLTLAASSPGAWGNALQVEVTHPEDGDADADDVADGQGVTAADLFSLTIRDGDPEAGGAAETFLNVTVVEGPRRVDVVLAASQLVRTVGDLPDARPGESAEDTPYTVADADEGRDGALLESADYEGSADGKTGIHALLEADLFNILCIPPPTPEGDLPEALWPVAAEFCFRQRAFLIVDPPVLETLASLPTWVTGDGGLTGATMRNAAIYFPRIRRPDPLRGGATADFAACGAIAGTYARTDGNRGVWKAPAGIEAGLAGVVGLTVPLTDAENGRLNPKGINCLRTFRGIGSVVWGARTLRGNDVLADEYKYVPVRRLALFLEESLYRNTQWVVFEPNDEPLWSQIRLSIGAFMQDLFRRGAFQGSSPRDAFFVRCDGDTTTQYDIDRGIVNILVGFAPLKPAEFVIITLQQKTASAGA